MYIICSQVSYSDLLPINGRKKIKPEGQEWELNIETYIYFSTIKINYMDLLVTEYNKWTFWIHICSMKMFNRQKTKDRWHEKENYILFIEHIQWCTLCTCMRIVMTSCLRHFYDLIHVKVEQKSEKKI